MTIAHGLKDGIRIWLDDIRPMPEFYTHHCKTATEAIALIQTGNVTHISLDHDLGNDNDGTGYHVARYIEERAYRREIPRINWQIHSANPVGRQRMTIAMQSADSYFIGHNSGE